ncbi:DUF7548 family protein [Halapricum hydrolyticum]|uniref:Uncharacterized protein n=1 Tax=Halapricum hydrolyticum TaxID=2979991 RepID=A0AAE3IED1_9EURY|nr:hypothetical protein [Halapricum hydrolyticum]MCU4719432.1 hypothetical protein [Halapricum hydrolyticum]MCU4728441.1 hypothetical protein [Halapricum hydrolyticum]
MSDSRRTAPLAGVVACLLVIGALAAPYAMTDARTVGLYYESGVVNPLIAGLLAVVSTVVFAAGYRRRTDPALAAGVTLTFGLFIVVLTVAWALTIPESLMRQFEVVEASLPEHRWALAVVTVTVPATAAWYARSLGLL